MQRSRSTSRRAARCDSAATAHYKPNRVIALPCATVCVAQLEEKSGLLAAEKAAHAKAVEQIENIRDWLEFDADDAPYSEYEQRAEILKSSFGVSVLLN